LYQFLSDNVNKHLELALTLITTTWVCVWNGGSKAPHIYSSALDCDGWFSSLSGCFACRGRVRGAWCLWTGCNLEPVWHGAKKSAPLSVNRNNSHETLILVMAAPSHDSSGGGVVGGSSNSSSSCSCGAVHNTTDLRFERIWSVPGYAKAFSAFLYSIWGTGIAYFRLRDGQRRRPVSIPGVGERFFPFSKAYIPGLVPTHPPTERVLVNLSTGVKQLGRGADHLSPTPMLRMSGSVYL